MHWGFDISNIDKSVRPADDFYQYANGNWLRKNPIPPDESRWGSFNLLRKKSVEALRAILKETVKQKALTGSDLQKVRDFYLSGMNTKKLSKYGAEPLSKFFKMIDQASNRGDIVSLAAYFHRIGVPVLWSVSADQDMKDRKITALYLEQGGLGLPDRDYYLKTDKKSKEIRKQYIAYIKKMHALTHREKTGAKKAVNAIMRIETRLAKASMTRVERRDYEKQYNKMPVSKLARMAPSIGWKKYFKSVGVANPRYLIVMQPLYIKEADEMLKTISLLDWKHYLKWKVSDAFANYLSDGPANLSFWFYGKVLSGITKMKPRWRRVAEEIDSGLGEALGQLYVKKYFREGAKRRINELVDNLIAAYEKRIMSLDWMGDSTKKKALEKLKAFSRKLGYPDKWRNYGNLKISRDSYLENHINAYKFEFLREMKKIGKRPDKKEWHMTPPTVNAYNNFLFNEIVFPAGIMQPPFFDPKADDAVNYGAIGSVIGHELTHGFDDQGSKFNKNGEMKNWWNKKDQKMFEKKAKGLVKQFNKYEALPWVFINGKLTLGENIADLGGLVIAYWAYQKALAGQKKKIIGGFTPEQRFFLGAAQAEQGHAKAKETRRLINIDPHSPSKSRVNIPLSNMDEFYGAFDAKKGDRMFIPKKDRVAIW
ncbi:MAG: M13 family metallopeptidase [Candidatus Giovannonibacteria bacterium]|nr:M13 family metallopeptidase [Candidatus Giovannonibacteria bacterium]